jgi:phosphoribosylformimino-5-aminoimidazole carboxamide ribotide isomerase
VSEGFELYPSIDLRGGRVVRLLRGDFAAETVYGDDPVAVAREFADAGARWIHVVDLDASRTGDPANVRVIEAICAAVDCSVQTGGGVRSAVAATRLLEAGIARVVIGTAAVEQPELVDELCLAYPGAIAVGLDARGLDVAVRGWTEGGGADLPDLLVRFARSGAAAVVVTQIHVDGTLEGPDVATYELALATDGPPVIASGGVGGLDDLRRLAAVRIGERGLAGVVVGRAIYEGRFTVRDALATVALHR